MYKHTREADALSSFGSLKSFESSILSALKDVLLRQGSYLMAASVR